MPHQSKDRLKRELDEVELPEDLQSEDTPPTVDLVNRLHERKKNRDQTRKKEEH